MKVTHDPKRSQKEYKIKPFTRLQKILLLGLTGVVLAVTINIVSGLIEMFRTGQL